MAQRRIDALKILLLLEPKRVHDLELALQPARRDVSGILIVAAVQSPVCQRRINSAKLRHQRSKAVKDLLRIAGVFNGYGKDAVSNFAAESEVCRGWQAHQDTCIFVGGLRAIS